MLFRTSASAQEVVAVGFEVAQQAVFILMAGRHGFRSRFFCQQLALDKSGDLPAVSLAAMGVVFGNAVLDQFIGRRISGFIQMGFDFFPQGLLRGKGRGQRLDLLQAEGRIRRDFFLRAGMVEERAQQFMDSLTLHGVVELPGNILHRLGVILAVVHTGTIKLANKAQHLGGQRRIGVWGFFFLGRFLYPGRHGEHRRVLGSGNRHFRGIRHPLDFLPHRLGHFLIINRYRAVGADVGYCFIVSVFFLQPVPDGEAVPQVAIAQVVGFERGRGCGRRLLVFCKEGKRTLPEGGEVFKGCFPPLIHPVALRGGLPNGNHHLVDFLHAGRVVKLRLDDLHCVPIVEAKRIGVRLFLGHVLKERADIPGKLVLLILRHGGTVVLG